jgi:hypothetical protein
MHVTPLLSWDVIHPCALAWTDEREALACDVPRGIELRVEPATKSEPVVIADRPWEQRLVWTQVMADDGRYRMWYGAIRDARRPNEILCYAESEDGLTWRKPELGLVEADGGTANNVVRAGPGATHFCIVRCEHETPQKRYRCMSFKSWCEGEPGEEIDSAEGHRRLDAKNAAKEGDQVLPVSMHGTMLGFDSPDGLRWTPIRTPILDEWHDTHNICVYDETAGLYRAYLRGFYGGRRAISYSETSNFEHWPASRVIHQHTADDRPDESLYSNAYTRYPGRPDIHLMFPSIYRQGSDTTYGQLAVSLDGLNWSRLTRQAIIPHGRPGEPDEGMVYPEPELIRFPREGKFRLLCVSGNEYHNAGYNPTLRQRGPSGYYNWAEWPEDRLAGIRASGDGEFTLNMQACGDRMLANFRTEPDGWVRFELVDRLVWPPQQWPGIERFRFENMDPITGDQTHAPVRWHGDPSLSTLGGGPIGIRVRLHKATLFSMTLYGVDEPLVQADPRFPV